MSRMLRLELVGLVLLACTQILTEHRDFYEPRPQYGYHSRFLDPPERVTREVRVQQGRLRGMVVQPRTSRDLQLVDVFLGVPYAEPPVGSLRFSPPRSPEAWRGVRQSEEFAPVCPQTVPKLRDEVRPVRYEYLEKLLPYLKNQSEDCLYLNIYAPHQPEGQKTLRKYPVMVFIHGESFEWNSGNPYDGTILVAYGNVVFVTINFRLGILGFLRPGTGDSTVSNFGLLDQIAALLWLRENIANFGGDPNSITLVGHGTGAIFANLLLISPVANKKGLFKRAILMSGSALSADAIGKAPLQITKQQQRQRTVHGEELPYVLGVPLDGGKYDLRRRYNIGETLFSEAMMNWWCSFAYVGNPNIAKRYPYLTDGPREWSKYEIEWPEYDPQNQTYLNLTIPPKTGSHYRSEEMQFWNEYLPDMLRHPSKDILLSIRPKGPRPQILDIADGIGKYGNTSANRNYETPGISYGSDHSTMPTASEERSTTPESTSGTVDESIPQPSMPKSSSVITMLTGFGVVFLLINFTAFLFLYCKKQDAKTKGLKRRVSQKEDPKRAKSDKYENHYGELGYKSDSKPDLNDVIKNDKAYDNNSNFGRRSKLSRQNSGSTIDTHIKVREWIQQEIVHRCSPRFLRKTRETLQKEHEDKLTKQQEEEKKRLEEELLKERKEEPIYDENPALVVRPGKKSKLPKVSVAIDATPATRTESILNQVPIELAKGVDPAETFNNSDYPLDQLQIAPQVVVIEHHHSRSDPLPMESVLKSVKTNFSTPRIYESDSGSASSLYAKINPKLKSRLPRVDLGTSPEEPVANQTEDIYINMGPKLTTFAVNPPCDINVTCREPVAQRECVSPEEALRTIKRRNYPKVLPDIEKRRSLPAPSSLFVPKQHANSLKDYRSGLQSHQPPQPPPRMFGPSKSLDFAEEGENQYETESITTNLHVGPLVKKQDYSGKNNSDPSIIDSLDDRIDRARTQAGGSVDTIYSNPMCPVHGMPISQSMDKNLGKPAGLLESGIGNPNWYKSSGNETSISTASSEPRIIGREVDKQFGGSNWDTRVPAMEPRIVITPRVGNLLGQANQNLSQTVVNLASASADRVDQEPKMTVLLDTSRSKSNTNSVEQLPESTSDARAVVSPERKEPRIIITPRDTKGPSNLKQPKIIIKPTSSLQRTRDHRNIPKVSAIPPPEAQSCQSVEKPALKEKPKVTRIPSFSRRKDEPSSGIEGYPEKTEIVQRVEAVTSKVVNASVDGKSSIPLLKKEADKSSSTDSSTNTNTGTIKKKPVNRK
ncbi:uncharacterized protein LOC100877010 isoform X4 [Megachile rotundata]|uniref:uncharacterized protein LOC100877010 isoform X4 n=1 Tax=Megachile rotundata TaxID=143995 RepID=UPI003FD20353